MYFVEVAASCFSRKDYAGMKQVLLLKSEGEGDAAHCLGTFVLDGARRSVVREACYRRCMSELLGTMFVVDTDTSNSVYKDMKANISF